jgi:hypothetical protein
MPYLHVGGPPLVDCLLLLIEYSRRYPPYLEAVSSIRNLRTRHAVVTRDPLNSCEDDGLLASQEGLSLFQLVI